MQLLNRQRPFLDSVPCSIDCQSQVVTGPFTTTPFVKSWHHTQKGQQQIDADSEERPQESHRGSGPRDFPAGTSGLPHLPRQCPPQRTPGVNEVLLSALPIALGQLLSTDLLLAHPFPGPSMAKGACGFSQLSAAALPPQTIYEGAERASPSRAQQCSSGSPPTPLSGGRRGSSWHSAGFEASSFARSSNHLPWDG